MKTPSDKLFRLIHSMTAAEKRYFKRHYSSGKNRLTELFDLLNSQTAYNEASVKEHFSGSKLVKNLKVYKVQLSELLLKSLASYNYKNSVEARIRCGIEEIQILLSKQLNDIAKGKTKRLKKYCLEHEAYPHLITVLELEAQASPFHGNGFGNIPSSTIQELEKVRTHIDRQFYLKQLETQLNQQLSLNDGQHYLEKHPSIFQKIEQWQARSLTEKHYWHQAMAALHALDGNLKQSLQFKKSDVELFEKHKKRILSRANLHFRALYQYLSACIVQEHFKAFDQKLPALRRLIRTNPHLQHHQISVLNLILKRSFGQNRFEQINEKMEKEVHKVLNKFRKKPVRIVSSLYLRLAVTHLFHSNVEKTLHYLREIETNGNKNTEIVQQVIFILELFSHYESKAPAVIDNLLVSLKRRTKKNTYTPFFLVVLSLFQKLTQCPEKMHPEVFSTFYQNLSTYQPDPCYQLFKDLALELWLVTKARKTSLQQAIQLKKTTLASTITP